jgi:hypothetical protein
MRAPDKILNKLAAAGHIDPTIPGTERAAQLRLDEELVFKRLWSYASLNIFYVEYKHALWYKVGISMHKSNASTCLPLRVCLVRLLVCHWIS